MQPRAAQPSNHRVNVGQKQLQAARPAAAPMPSPLHRRPLNSASDSQSRPAQNQQAVRPSGLASASPGTVQAQPHPMGAQRPVQHQHRPFTHTIATPRPMMRPPSTRPPGAILNSARPTGSAHAGSALHSSQISPQTGTSRPDGGQQQWHAFLKHRIQQHSGQAAAAEAPGASAGRPSAANAHQALQQWSTAPGSGQRSGTASGTNAGTCPVQQVHYASPHGQQVQQAQSPQAQQQYQQQQNTQSPQQFHQSPPKMQQHHRQHQQNHRQQELQHHAEQQHAKHYRTTEHQ